MRTKCETIIIFVPVEVTGQDKLYQIKEGGVAKLNVSVSATHYCSRVQSDLAQRGADSCYFERFVSTDVEHSLGERSNTTALIKYSICAR